MIYCSNCGTANRDGSRFCNECGARLGSFVACPACNFPNLTTARFCNGCGKVLSLSPAVVPSAVVQDGLGESVSVEEEEPLESEVPILGSTTATVGTELDAASVDRQDAHLSSLLPEFESGSDRRLEDTEPIVAGIIAPDEPNAGNGYPNLIVEAPPTNVPASDSLAVLDYPEPSAIEASDAMSESLLMDMLGEAEAAEIAGFPTVSPESDSSIDDASDGMAAQDVSAVIGDLSGADGFAAGREEEESDVELEERPEEPDEAETEEQEGTEELVEAPTPADDLLPSWMTEERSDSVASTVDRLDGEASPSNGYGRLALDGIPSDGRATSSESDDGIALARSLSSERRGEAAMDQVAAFVGAGAAFVPSAEQSWQPIADEKPPAKSSAPGKVEVGTEKADSRGQRIAAALGVLAAIVVIVALVYVFDAPLAHAASNGLPSAIREVIAQMLSLAGQK